MEKENQGVLQASGSDITLVVSKAPICSPIVETIPSGKSFQELADSLTGISLGHTTVLHNGEKVEDMNLVPEGGSVSFLQAPAGLETITIAAIVSAVVGSAIGFLMYESPETVSEGEKQRRVRGDKNQNKGYEPLPFVLGRRKVVPAYAAHPFSEWIGEQQYYYMLLHIGYGPLRIEEIKIGDVDIASFDDDTEYAWVDWYENTDLEPLKGVWSKNTAQNMLNEELPRVDNFLTTTIPVGKGKVDIVYNYPQGLRWQAGRGPVSVMNSVQFQFQGSDGLWYTPCYYSEWKGITDVAFDLSITETWAPYYGLIKNVNYSGLWGIAGAVDFRHPVNNLLAVTQLPSSEVVYDDGKGFAIVRGDRKLASNSYMTNTGESFTKKLSFRLSDVGAALPDETSPIPFRARNLHESNTSKKPIIDRVDLLTVSRSAEITDSEFKRAIGYPQGDDNEDVRQVVLALKIRASEQLTGTVDDLNVIASSVTPSDMSLDWRNWWTDTGLRSSLQVTNNPAELYKWVLQGPMNPARVGLNRIDTPSLQSWQSNCVSEGWETSALMNEAATLKDTLNNIAKTGRANFSMRNGIFSVVENVERTIPVQVFTPKNSRDFSSKREFPDPSDGITIEFQNEDEDFEVDEWTYYDPTIPVVDRVGQTDSMEMWGISNPLLAQKHSRFAYFEKKLRREVYTLTTDIEGLVCERGSLVRVANDVVDIGLGQGFIKSIDPSNFVLDETVGLDVGLTYALTVRSVDGGAVISTFTSTYLGNGFWSNTLPVNASVGDLVSYGEPGKVTLDCIVKEISYKDNYEATLTLVNAANEIYTYDGDSLPAYETALTPRPDKFKPAIPTLIVSTGQALYGKPTLKVVVSNAGKLTTGVESYKLQYRIQDEYFVTAQENEVSVPYAPDNQEAYVWFDAGFSPSSEAVFHVPMKDNLGSRYFFRAKAYGKGNLTSDWSEEYSVTVSDAPSPDVVDFTITEKVNEPKTADGVYSTLVVDVDEPAQAPYLYSIVEYRTPSDDPFDPDNPWLFISKVGWQFANTAEVVVLANGSNYEFRVRSVSSWKVENRNGPTKVFQTTNTQDPDYDEQDPQDILPVPYVRGLELFGQGNDTEFTGQDAKFTWKKSSESDWVDLGYEGKRGAGASRLDQYFKDYEVEIWADNKVIRREFVVDNLYTYTYEKNAEDFEAENGIVGAYREFEIRVSTRGRNNQISFSPATLSVSNPPPEPLTSLSVFPGFNVIEVQYNRPDDLDFAGVDVWVETVSGFDPEATEPFATLSDNSVVLSGMTQSTQYYVRLRPFDLFGKVGTNITAEYVITTKDATDLTGLSGWAYEIDPVDRTFIEDNLANGAVPSEKIVNLTAAKITAGVINATETITAEGVIRAVDDINTPQYQVGVGPAIIDGVTYLMWGYDSLASFGDKLRFGIDELGNATFNGGGSFSGTVSIGAGSTGVANLSDAGALATKNTADSGDVTFNYAGSTSKGGNANDTNKVAGEFATTVRDHSDRAGFGLNSAGEVVKVVSGSKVPSLNPGSSGLYLTNQYLGWHNGNSLASGWQTYIRSNGQFHFGGVGSNYLDWDGTTLVLALNQIGAGGSIGVSSVAFGDNSVASGSEAVSVGQDSSATGNASIALGRNVTASGNSTLAFGTNSVASTLNSLAIGVGSISNGGDRAISLGSDAQATQTDTLAIGTSSRASKAEGMAIGTGAQSSLESSIAIGRSANCLDSFLSPQGSIAIGAYCEAQSGSVSIGYSADSVFNASTISNSVCIGYFSETKALDAIAIGGFSTANHNNSGAIGHNVQASAADQFKIGNSANEVVIDGDFSVGGTKSFDIPHPTDSTKRVNHGAYEGPVPGGNIYRYDVQTSGNFATIQLPDYFEHINKDIQVMCQADEHFGRAYGRVNGNMCNITSDSDGPYHVIIFATRDDEGIQKWYDKGDCYTVED